MNKGPLADKVTVVVFSRILTALIDWTTIVIVVNLLSETDFAILSYFLMVYEIAKNVATLGFPESIFYYFERVSKNSRRAFAVQTTAILFLTASIAAIGIVLYKFLIPFVLPNFTQQSIQIIQEYLPLIALIAVLEIPTWPVNNILLALERQKEAGWYQIITSIFSFTAIILPLWLGFPFVYAVYGLLTYAIIRFVVSFVWVSLVIPEGPIRQEEATVKEQVVFSIPLGISSLVNQFNKYIDKYLVFFFFGEAIAANYGVGANEVPILRVIPFAVGSVLISRYVNFNFNNKREELLSLWHKSIEKVALLVIPLTILSIVAAKELIPVLYETTDTDYSRAVIPFQIYNLIILIRVAHYGGILQAFGDTKGILNLSLTLLAINLGLSIPATYFFGIVGTALATLIANIINWYFILRKVGRHMDIPFYKVIPLTRYFSILGLSSIIGAALYVWKEYYAVDLTGEGLLMYTAIIFIVAYLVFGTMFKVISRSDWQLFINAVTLRFFWRKS